MGDKVMPVDIDCVSTPRSPTLTDSRSSFLSGHSVRCTVRKGSPVAVASSQVIAELPEELREQFGEDFVESTNDMFGELRRSKRRPPPVSSFSFLSDLGPAKLHLTAERDHSP